MLLDAHDRYHLGMSYDASAANVTLFVNGVARPRPFFQTTTYTPALINAFSKPYIGRSVYSLDSTVLCPRCCAPDIAPLEKIRRARKHTLSDTRPYV
jgi:hypothetical protein